MEKVEEIKTVTPQALASKIGVSPKHLRAILRTEYPKVGKGKRWEIPLDVARKIERTYKAKVKAKNEKREAQTKEELQSG
jgi:hypothetical protein